MVRHPSGQLQTIRCGDYDPATMIAHPDMDPSERMLPADVD